MSLINELMCREGYREDIYKDITGLETGGYGHLLTNKDDKEYISSLSSSKKKAYWTNALIKDMLDASYFIDNLIDDWKYYPNEIQRDVLIELCFNLGATRLLGFRKFLKHMSVGNIQDATRELIDSKWHRDFVKWNSGRDTSNIRSRVLESKLLRST